MSCFSEIIADFERESFLMVEKLRQQRADEAARRVPVIAGAPSGLEERAGGSVAYNGQRNVTTSKDSLQAQLNALKSNAITDLDRQIAFWEALNRSAAEGFLLLGTTEDWLGFRMDHTSLCNAAARARRIRYVRPAPPAVDLAGDVYF